jgi:hypothetical protein
MNNFTDPNLAILMIVAEALGDLRNDVVLVGGCATGLLVSQVRAEEIRVTEDVDLVAEVLSIPQYHEMEKQLAGRGFHHDTSKDAPICRWVKGEVLVDLMPTAAGILGFHNRWYPYAMESAWSLELPRGGAIRVVSAPAFIATKIEAFKGRGKGDFLGSHDLEDIVTVIDGRSSLLDETRGTGVELRAYFEMEFGVLLAQNAFLESLPGHLPPDRASQLRYPGLVEKVRALSQINQAAG